MTPIHDFVPHFSSVTNVPISYPISHMNMGAISLAAESLSLIVLLTGWQASSSHHLKSVLLVKLRTSESGVLAITYLDTEEYGWGKTENEAIIDLITSLVEYMESLEARQDQLGDSAVTDLEKLHALLT
jgi:hypothetical protein